MIALITGGAKRIGAYIAMHLARSGYDIILHYNVSESEAMATSNLIRSEVAGGANSYHHPHSAPNRTINCELVHADFLRDADIAKLIDLIQQRNIDVLVNNAAIVVNDRLRQAKPLTSKMAPAIPVTSNSLSGHMRINCEVPVLLMQAMGQNDRIIDFSANSIDNPSTDTQRHSRKNIINMLDWVIYKAPTNFCSYALSKFALYKATQVAAKSLAPNIRVNGIALGQVLVNSRQNIALHEGSVLASPLQCKPSIEEIERIVTFILKSNSMTGHIINIDGGMHLNDGNL